MFEPKTASTEPKQPPAEAKPQEPVERSLRSQLAHILPDDDEDQDGPAPAFGRSRRDEDKRLDPEGARRPLLARNDSSDSFVAAARRAAQAAAAQADKNAGSSWTDKARARFSGSNSAVAEDAEPASGRKKRSYLMLFAVFLLIVSAFLLYGRLKSKPATVSAPQPTQSAPAQSGAAPQSGTLTPEKSSDDQSGSIATPVRIGALNAGSDPVATPTQDRADIGQAHIDHAVSTTPTPAPVPVSLTTNVGNGLPPGVSMSVTPPVKLSDSSQQNPAVLAAANVQLPPPGTGNSSLRAAAAKGDPRAQYLIGLHYADANGAAKNMKQAARWFHLAATSGLAVAQYRLGVLYERGDGVDFDLGMAQAWYARAAAQGNLKAMHNLAVVEGAGQNGHGDYTTAAQWYKKAAQRGLADSQFNLAVLEEHGMGVAVNLPEAYKWYALAAKQGDKEAARRRDGVASRLTAAQLATENEVLAKWKPAQINAAANRVTPEPAWLAAAQPAPSKALVSQAQGLLNKLGYDAGPTDGAMGERTRAAVLSFERKNGLPETGEVNAKLVTRLEKLAS